MSKLPVNAVGVMELGFAGLKFIQELVQDHKYFLFLVKK
jgi:putative transposase